MAEEKTKAAKKKNEALYAIGGALLLLWLLKGKPASASGGAAANGGSMAQDGGTSSAATADSAVQGGGGSQPASADEMFFDLQSGASYASPDAWAQAVDPVTECRSVDPVTGATCTPYARDTGIPTNYANGVGNKFELTEHETTTSGWTGENAVMRYGVQVACSLAPWTRWDPVAKTCTTP